ncbi:hypothetical protein ALC53_06371 [Atta colombica]|uniref:Uncharacterized protein n=1 Tax=Atta colombica TaxID=520822 RepID=A0A195BG11_9HYME|nr:hypothetical protein ALC53_06371 [Atta colombica]
MNGRRAPCLLGVNAWRARRFARVPVSLIRCDAALRVPAFPAENGFRRAGRSAAALWHSGCRRCSVTIVYTHQWLQHKQQDLPAQVSFRLISRLDDFLEQNPIDFTTKH